MASVNVTNSPVQTETNGVHENGVQENGVHEKLMANGENGTAAEAPSSTIISPKVLCSPPCRFIFAFMGFFCFFNLYALRVNLSVALVRMVNVTYMKQLEIENAALTNATIHKDPIDCEEANKTASATQDGPFNWDSKQQGTILAAFFYGYIFTQIPGGMLAEKFGGKLVLLVGIAWTALLTLLTPVIAEAGGFAGLVAIRVLEGLGEGVAFPAMHVMISAWAPPLERGRLATFVYAGAQIGTVVAMPISGVLCQTVNWQSVFYVFGAIGVVWSVMWIFLVYDRPSSHPRISPQERNYIETSQGPQRAKGVTLKTPWLKMVTSPSVYAVMMGNFAHNWGNFFIMTTIPQFLSYILKFDIQSSGAVAGAPYLTMWFGMLLGGTVTDFLLSRHLMSVTTVRKLFCILGFVVPTACLIGIGFVNCEKEVAVFCLVVTGFCLGLSWGGWGVNHMDIAPPFAGTVFGITNCISTIPGFVAPAIVGALTYRNQTRAAWRNAFYITGGVLMFGTLVFIICGTGKRQRWSYPESEIPAENGEDPVLLKSTKTDEEKGEKKNGAGKSANSIE